MTLYNTRVKRLVKQKKIEKEYADNDRAVRRMLLDRGLMAQIESKEKILTGVKK